MKSSVAFIALLCAPEVFAVALPHMPKLNSRWYHKEELGTNDIAHAKRGRTHDNNELKPRAAGPFEVVRPSSSPATTTLPGTGISGPSTTPEAAAAASTSPLGMLPLPAATIHNPFVGNHPFIGHGPVVRYPTATPSASDYGQNFTLTYLATGTAPPIANATATIYIPPIIYPISNNTANVTTCDEVPELIDANGNFLPGDLQPKYNGSSHCVSSIVNTTYTVAGPEAERIVVEGHIVGENEIVEVEVTPLPMNISSWNNTADGNYGTYYGANPTGYVYPSGSTSLPYSTESIPIYVGSGISSSFSAPTSTSISVPHQRVPTSSTPGFTGPKVRRAAVSPESGELTDLDVE
ncbi:hypothetical protein G7Y79_00007g022780 [Physcia stellaris]|nr:hypothetical protein G7Y79_00007g022780 [Physcia stellaris]